MMVTGAENYVTGFTYDQNNRLLTEYKDAGATESTYTVYDYDPNGNTVFKNTWTQIDSSTPAALDLQTAASGVELFTYDGFNRMTSSLTNGDTTTYAYRPDGLRLNKTTGGVVTRHVFDGSNISADLTGTTVIRIYLRGVGLIASEGSTGATTRQYYHFNAHGDVTGLSNTAGNIAKAYDYDAFGVERNPGAADANPFRYAGEYYDLETKTYYLRARSYSPTTGRFLSEDPFWNIGNMIYGDDPLQLNQYTMVPSLAAIRQSNNLYVYTMNNPVMFTDSTGLSASATVVIGGATYFLSSPIGQQLVLEATQLGLAVGNFVALYGQQAAFIIETYGGTILDSTNNAIQYAADKAEAAFDSAKQWVNEKFPGDPPDL